MMQGLEDQYNTQLAPEEEAQFQSWAKDNGKLKDAFDYDIRGFWKQNQGQTDERGHGPDTFKKPNHPTFSNKSMYHTPENPGGQWQQLPDGKYTFAPAAGNMKYWDQPELQQYFNTFEKGNQLLAPAPLSE